MSDNIKKIIYKGQEFDIDEKDDALILNFQHTPIKDKNVLNYNGEFIDIDFYQDGKLYHTKSIIIENYLIEDKNNKKTNSNRS
jgi:hypothetical protein